MNYKILDNDGAILNQKELNAYLEKFSSRYKVSFGTLKETYPIPRLLENYKAIKEVYNLLNEHVKINIPIHPAGEWLLDNFYIIEEVVKTIEKDLTLKKYKKLPKITNGQYKGFARIYVLASKIVSYTDSKINREVIEESMIAYQINSSLSMNEIWNIGPFMQIAIIENIRRIAEDIYISQVEKYKVESIVEKWVDLKSKFEYKFDNFKVTKNFENNGIDVKYPFVEYMSYKLKKYGKKTEKYLKILKEEVLKTGTNLTDVISHEHFDIAIKKISMGNSIISLKKIQRINFLEIFEKINGVEEILKKDPAKIYTKMDYKTKEMYRNTIKDVSEKTKISEIYIGKKILELAEENKTEQKKSHIGYYLMDENIWRLYDKLQLKKVKKLSNNQKSKIYLFLVLILTFFIDTIFSFTCPHVVQNMGIRIISFLFLFMPSMELIIQTIQYISSKIKKPKIIPKLDFSKGIPEEESTFVIIPTILNDEEKVKQMMKKLEISYLANKSRNLYFCLLGDCQSSNREIEDYDIKIVEIGKKLIDELNKKNKSKIPIFHFVYRKRKYNQGENSYLGWERKRGAITDFVEFLNGNMNNLEFENKFWINTINDYRKSMPKIKYVITLDSDTDLVLNSAFELVGSMAHILNKPEIQDGKVTNGYGLIQPRIGINLDVSYKSLFTKIFANNGGIDAYSNAISNFYQDNFDEGIFTGKGIFDIELYSKILKNEIPENTVLSHDLLEGSYLRCGLASDILLMDGYPSKYNSYVSRLTRWIRGDWQIIRWLKNKKLNILSKIKIFDNLRRSTIEISIFFALIYFILISKIFKVNTFFFTLLLLVILVYKQILEIFNLVIFKKQGEKMQYTFTPKINGIKGAIYRAILIVGELPYKLMISLKSIIKTLYRLFISKKHLLEWTTSEEAEKLAKDDCFSYYKNMIINVVCGMITLIFFVVNKSIIGILIGILWVVIPYIMSVISKDIKEKKAKEKLNTDEIKYIKDIGNKTFNFFKDNLNEKNHYLIPDNYQDGRKELYVDRTSSTNIGLSLMAIQAGIDLDYINLNDGLMLLVNVIKTIENLEKWNGHLYNWYNIKTMEPLSPRYVSTVDSGNFVGYMYVTKAFLLQKKEDTCKEDGTFCCKFDFDELINKIEQIITNTDFSKLYSKEHKLFSIGFNVDANELTDSYYDLLATEARQASLVAIIKKDVDSKHWNYLSRTLTVLDKRKGLISWSGTAFEYLMPNINIPRYKGSLIDESSKFAIDSQIKYAKFLGIPWGISEAAFNVMDLHSNYQYKAFGIPWLGLKRGLADEIVIATYASVLAISDKPKEVIKNLIRLENFKMLDKYGFYESLDFSSQRLKKGEKYATVKTYMAHHQALILLSINNLLNNNIFQNRFMINPEVKAIDILLQEKMPETFIITKEEKEKPEMQKYKDYEAYSIINFENTDNRLIRSNVISNGEYTIVCNQNNMGYSKYKNIFINRFKRTDEYDQGIIMYVKDTKDHKILKIGSKGSLVRFAPNQIGFEKNISDLKTSLNITIDTEEAVEIRNLQIENLGENEKEIEVSVLFEPILSSEQQDYSHPVFNNLFLMFNYDDKNNILEAKRRKRGKNEQEVYLDIGIYTDGETIVDNEFEIDKEKVMDREFQNLPASIEKSIPFSNKVGLVTEPMVTMRKTIKIKSNEKINVNLILSVNEEEELSKNNLIKYKNFENVKRAFEISKVKLEAEARYLDIKGKEIELYQKILGYILFDNSVKSYRTKNLEIPNFRQSDLWKYGISGDLPIILVKIKDSNDVYIIKYVLKMYEFFRSRNIDVDLVFLDEENSNYRNYVKNEIEIGILDKHLSYMKNIKGGIYVLSKNNIISNDYKMLRFLASFTIDVSGGDLEHLTNDLEEECLGK